MTHAEQIHDKFKRQTVEALAKCAEYLAAHKEELAEQFCAMPSRGWSIEFRAGDDDGFPWVEVNTSQRNVDVVRAYQTGDSKRF